MISRSYSRRVLWKRLSTSAKKVFQSAKNSFSNVLPKIKELIHIVHSESTLQYVEGWQD
jgi:hypothetical protein